MLRAAPSAPQKSPPLKKSECSKLLRVLPKKLSSKNPHPQNPSCSECSELLRVLQKSYRKKSTIPKKSECSELLRVLPKKLSPQKNPHPKPLILSQSQAPIVRYSALPSPLPSPINPHTILSLPHAPPHTIFASKKSQISHAHKHNAFQFRLRNRNISSS